MLRPQSRTIPDLLDELAARQPEHELIVDATGRVRLGYAETRARARRLARGLVRLGVRRGDRVALLMTNRPEWLLIDFAVTLLGATLVPISTWSRPRELEYVLGHCAASVLIDRAALREPGLPGRARRDGRARAPRACRTSGTWSSCGDEAARGARPARCRRSRPSPSWARA